MIAINLRLSSFYFFPFFTYGRGVWQGIYTTMQTYDISTHPIGLHFYTIIDWLSFSAIGWMSIQHTEWPILLLLYLNIELGNASASSSDYSFHFSFFFPDKGGHIYYPQLEKSTYRTIWIEYCCLHHHYMWFPLNDAGTHEHARYMCLRRLSQNQLWEKLLVIPSVTVSVLEYFVTYFYLVLLYNIKQFSNFSFATMINLIVLRLFLNFSHLSLVQNLHGAKSGSKWVKG